MVGTGQHPLCRCRVGGQPRASGQAKPRGSAVHVAQDVLHPYDIQTAPNSARRNSTETHFLRSAHIRKLAEKSNTLRVPLEAAYLRFVSACFRCKTQLGSSEH